MEKSKITIGVAGSCGRTYEDAFKELKNNTLNALEVEFTYGVRMKNSVAKKIGELARKYDIKLSVHAPYYINLASPEEEKVEASMKRILDSCERGHNLGAKSIVFHAGF